MSPPSSPAPPTTTHSIPPLWYYLAYPPKRMVRRSILRRIVFHLRIWNILPNGEGRRRCPYPKFISVAHSARNSRRRYKSDSDAYLQCAVSTQAVFCAWGLGRGGRVVVGRLFGSGPIIAIFRYSQWAPNLNLTIKSRTPPGDRLMSAERSMVDRYMYPHHCR